MIFEIRMICGEDDDFIRDYEVPYHTTLLEFDTFICKDLGYDEMHMSSFFASNERWEQEQEFTLMDMGEGGPIPMEKATLGQLLHQNNDRLIYVFDTFSERVMFLELMGAGKGKENTSYPRVSFSQGEPPAQFDFKLDDNTDEAIFEEAMDDYFDFGGDDFYDDDF